MHTFLGKSLFLTLIYPRIYPREFPMALAKLGSYDAVKRGWVFMNNGKRHYISCKALGLPRNQWNERDSTIAARKHFEGILGVVVDPFENHKNHLGNKIEIAQKLGLQDEIAALAKRMRYLQKISEDHPFENEETQKFLHGMATIAAVGETNGEKKDWDDRAKIAKLKEGQKSIKTSVLLNDWLDGLRVRTKPQTFGELERFMRIIEEECLLPVDVATIDESTVKAMVKWLETKDWQGNVKNKRLGFFRRFVDWLVEEKHLDIAPRNLKSKSQRFKESRKEIKEFDNVADALKALPEKMKLWMLLGLNCGMTQADWGMLDWKQIDLVRGTLTRIRGKLYDNPKAPKVTYELWPETVAELKKLQHRKGLVFAGLNGQPLYSTFINDKGKASKNDQFSTQYNRLPAEQRKIPLGKFRSIGATALCGKPVYRQYRDVFLANVPTDIGAIHYGAEHAEAFAECCRFIRKELILQKS